MFDGLAGVYGKGTADDFVDALVRSFAKSDGGQALVHGLVNTGGERLEEITSGLIEPALQGIYNGKTLGENYRELSMADLWHEGDVAMLLGLFGGGVDVARTGSGRVRSYADALRNVLAEQNESALGANADSFDARYEELERKFLDGSISPDEGEELWRLERMRGQFDASDKHNAHLAKNSEDRYTQIELGEENIQQNFGLIEEDNNGREEITGNQRGTGGAQKETGDRSGVQSRVRSIQGIDEEENAEFRERHDRLIRQGAEYNLPVHIVKESDWDLENVSVPAYSRNGEIYINENFPDEVADGFIPHESTHVMRQMKFSPYIDFLTRTPEMIDTSSKWGLTILEEAARHRNIDPFDMTDEQANILYDEINATICNVAILDAEGDLLTKLRDAFFDYDSYKRELQSIHQQFKDARKSKPVDNIRYQELERKFLDGTISPEEAVELLELESSRG